MSVNFADVYGMTSQAVQSLTPTTVGGPTQGAVAPAARPAPQGMTGAGPGMAFSWIAMIGLLVAWRVAIEMGGKEA